jgi:UDP-glucose 4-epimerase
VTIIRPSNVYGPGQPYRPGFGIIPAAFHALLQQEKFPIWGDGGAVRDYLYIQDFVDLCMQILDKPPTDSPSLVHASSGIGIRLDALLDEIEGAAGRKILRDLTPDHAVDVSRVVLCNDESRKRYDWSPTTSLPEGLQRAWAWYSEHGA